MPEQPPPPRKRGRPPNPEAAKRRNNVTIRMSDELKTNLQRVADFKGTSLSEAVERQLEGSFLADQHLTTMLGGLEVRNISLLMAATFARAIQRHADMNPRQGWTTKEWLRDPHCYRAAMTAVTEALFRDFPSDDPEERFMLIESLRGRLASEIANNPKRNKGNG